MNRTVLSHKPSARVTPVTIHNGVAHISGQLPREKGKLKIRGKVGADIGVEEAQDATRLCVIACLEQLQLAIAPGGSIQRILKLTGFVASASGFTQQGAVLDAASDVFIARLGDRGTHARSAIGGAELPHGAPVEIEMTAAIAP